LTDHYVGGHSWRPYHTSSIYEGYIDNISIWKRVLPQPEIMDMMYRRLSGKEHQLVGFWGFNEGSGQQTRDLSPNENHGYLRGDPQWIVSISKPLNDPSVIER
jgi:hypothetical protein